MSIEITNPLSIDYASIDIDIARTTYGLTCRDLGLTPPRKPRHLAVDFAYVDPVGACIKVEYGDGSAPEYYGETASCLSIYSSVSHIPISVPFLRTHYYSNKGVYIFKVEAKTLISEDRCEKPITVIKSDCSSPDIVMKPQGNCHVPVKINGGNKIVVSGVFDLKCANGMDNTKMWRIQKIDSQYCKPIPGGEIDVKKISFSTYTTARIIVPRKQSLEYGTYKFTYTYV